MNEQMLVVNVRIASFLQKAAKLDESHLMQANDGLRKHDRISHADNITTTILLIERSNIVVIIIQRGHRPQLIRIIESIVQCWLHWLLLLLWHWSHVVVVASRNGLLLWLGKLLLILGVRLRRIDATVW